MSITNATCVVQSKKNVLRPYFLEILKEKITKKNENVMAAFVGAPGSGKSYGALSAAEIIDPSFSVDRVCFSSLTFAKRLKQGIDSGEFKSSRISPKVLIYEEMGVGHSSRNFFDSINKGFNFVTQTFRRENLICFFTLPKVNMMDKQVRDLIHYIIMPTHVDRKKKIGWYRPYVLMQNPLMFGDSCYLMKAKIMDEGGVSEIEQFGLPLASQRLRLEYEEKKKEYNFTLYNDFIRSAERVESEKIHGR